MESDHPNLNGKTSRSRKLQVVLRVEGASGASLGLGDHPNHSARAPTLLRGSRISGFRRYYYAKAGIARWSDSRNWISDPGTRFINAKCGEEQFNSVVKYLADLV